MTGVVWITGAGKGLGRAAAREYARRGWRVAASARSTGDLQTLVDETASLPGSITAYPHDVTDEAAVHAALDAIERDLGPVDLAVFNAGTHIPLTAEAFASAPFRTLIEVNILGVVHGLAAILPRLIARRRGHVAVVASVAGYRGLPSAAAYGATKAALINMCESLKPELDRHGVRVTVVNPGFVRTPLTDRNTFPMPFLMEVDDAARRLVDGLATGRFEVTFPRRFTWVLKGLRILPYVLYFFLARRLVRT
jgi:NAD(P)-dependent dehydrogenase (short-subunit alcohol dehydrogenase family)